MTGVGGGASETKSFALNLIVSRSQSRRRVVVSRLFRLTAICRRAFFSNPRLSTYNYGTRPPPATLLQSIHTQISNDSAAATICQPRAPTQYRIAQYTHTHTCTTTATRVKLGKNMGERSLGLSIGRGDGPSEEGVVPSLPAKPPRKFGIRRDLLKFLKQNLPWDMVYGWCSGDFCLEMTPSNVFWRIIFGFKLLSAIIADKSKIFLIKYDSGNNLLFKLSRLSL